MVPLMLPKRTELPSGFLQDYLPYQMARAASRASGRLHALLERSGTPVPVWHALAALSDRDGQDTVNGLSEVCMTLQPTMSKLLQRMESEGLLRREPNPQDRRVVLVSLSPEGRRVAESLCAAARSYEREALAVVPAEELAAMRAAVHRLAEIENGLGAGTGKLPW